MLEIKELDLLREFDKYNRLALTQPIAVSRNGIDDTVLISREEYGRLRRSSRRVRSAEDYTEEELRAIAASTPPPESAQFDHELAS